MGESHFAGIVGCAAFTFNPHYCQRNARQSDHERSLLKVLLTVAAKAIRQVIRVTYGKLQVG